MMDGRAWGGIGEEGGIMATVLPGSHHVSQVAMLQCFGAFPGGKSIRAPGGRDVHAHTQPSADESSCLCSCSL